MYIHCQKQTKWHHKMPLSKRINITPTAHRTVKPYDPVVCALCMHALVAAVTGKYGTAASNAIQFHVCWNVMNARAKERLQTYQHRS